MSFSNWFRGIRGRLLLSAIFPIFAFIAISGLNIHGLSTMGTMLDNNYSDLIPNLVQLGHMTAQRYNIANCIWTIVANPQDKEIRKEFLQKMKDSVEEFKKYQEAYEAAPFKEEETKIYAPVQAHKAQFFSTTEAMISLLEKNTPEDDQKVREQFFSTWRPLGIEIASANTKCFKMYEELAQAQVKDKEVVYRQSLNITVFASAFAVFMLLGLLMWMAQKIAKSVGGVASSLHNSSHSVTGAIQQLTAAGQTLSQTATAAAASLEETVAALEEMSSMVKMNSDNAKQAAALSQTSRDSAEQGEKEIQNLISSMTEISKSSKKIEEIINVIDDIAFQTNLLALNAAVEAARAGEQGKGFAVVADAVRTLAQRSAVAAKDISTLIKDSVEKIDHGTEIADKSGTVLNNIVTSVKKVADLNHEIAAASNEQSTGIGQVGQAMNSLDQSSQNNASSAEEIAATAEEILKQAVSMQEKVAELNVVVTGTEAVTTQPPQNKNNDTPSEKKETLVAKKVAAKTSYKAPEKKSDSAPAKVLKFDTKKKVAKTEAAAIIPFDEDEESAQDNSSRAKLGTTDGF